MVQVAVVADGDDAGGVDSVVADAVVRWDVVAGGEGFGPVGVGLDGGAASQGAVWTDGVVVGQECVDLGLEFGDGGGCGLGP
ncbi:MAG: hypothetical protein QOC62_3912 [Mycobacterium sp.]|nr:hypothetical protein [Mycobacterium sp.]